MSHVAPPPSADTKRRAVRVPYSIEVTATSEHTFWSGFTQNLSEGGVFVATEHDVPMGTIVYFDLRLPGTERTWPVQAEVRWSRAADGEVPSGVGLRFIDLDAELSEAINQFVNGERDTLFYDDSE